MDRIDVAPRKIRGGKDILDLRVSKEFINSKSGLTSSTVNITGSRRTVFIMHPEMGIDQYSVRDIMQSINTDLICNLEFVNGEIRYNLVNSNDITNMDELNQAGIVYDLQYEDGVISYSVFNSLSPYFYEEDLIMIENAVTSLSYTNKTIIFGVVGEIQ
ncbi:hypothetical protein [Methanobrevibacter sp.]|uniref:hypothetical protein n=1 Tax=Methanobrevibacter sp. TaxID=66852 RepID=UPI00386B60B0